VRGESAAGTRTKVEADAAHGVAKVVHQIAADPARKRFAARLLSSAWRVKKALSQPISARCRNPCPAPVRQNNRMIHPRRSEARGKFERPLQQNSAGSMSGTSRLSDPKPILRSACTALMLLPIAAIARGAANHYAGDNYWLN
jgi:hypothetical protein